MSRLTTRSSRKVALSAKTAEAGAAPVLLLLPPLLLLLLLLLAPVEEDKDEDEDEDEDEDGVQGATPQVMRFTENTPLVRLPSALERQKQAPFDLYWKMSNPLMLHVRAHALVVMGGDGAGAFASSVALHAGHV